MEALVGRPAGRGVGSAVRAASRRLLLPLRAEEAVLLLPARDGAGDLEQRLRACRLLARWGLVEGAPVILDLGLSDEGRALAERLADALDAGLCAPDELRLLP